MPVTADTLCCGCHVAGKAGLPLRRSVRIRTLTTAPGKSFCRAAIWSPALIVYSSRPSCSNEPRIDASSWNPDHLGPQVATHASWPRVKYCARLILHDARLRIFWRATSSSSPCPTPRGLSSDRSRISVGASSIDADNSRCTIRANQPRSVDVRFVAAADLCCRLSALLW